MICYFNTYAEVLTRRFRQPDSKMAQHISPQREQVTSTASDRSALRKSSGKTNTNGNQTELASENKDSLNYQQKSVESQLPEARAFQGLYHEHRRSETQINNTQDSSNEKDPTNGSRVNSWKQQLSKVEMEITAKFDQWESRNHILFQELEQRLEENVDKLLEKRLSDVSIVVADMVTKRLAKMMGKILQNKGTHKQGVINTQPFNTQESSNGNQIEHKDTDTQASGGSKASHWAGNNTRQMLTELTKIGHTTKQATDPPHDKLIGSENTVK